MWRENQQHKEYYKGRNSKYAEKKGVGAIGTVTIKNSHKARKGVSGGTA